jgi:hypothetical protein
MWWDMEQSKEKLDLERLKLEREKIEIEKENFNRQQKTEIYKSLITAGSIFIPLLIAVLMIDSNLHIENLRADQEHSLSKEAAESNFILKAAEIVMSAGTLNGTKNRAEAMKILFPGYLGDDFADSFDPILYGNSTYEGNLIVYDGIFRGNISISDKKSGLTFRYDNIEFGVNKTSVAVDNSDAIFSNISRNNSDIKNHSYIASESQIKSFNIFA